MTMECKWICAHTHTRICGLLEIGLRGGCGRGNRKWAILIDGFELLVIHSVHWLIDDKIEIGISAKLP